MDKKEKLLYIISEGDLDYDTEESILNMVDIGKGRMKILDSNDWFPKRNHVIYQQRKTIMNNFLMSWEKLK